MDATDAGRGIGGAPKKGVAHWVVTGAGPAGAPAARGRGASPHNGPLAEGNDRGLDQEDRGPNAHGGATPPPPPSPAADAAGGRGV